MNNENERISSQDQEALEPPTILSERQRTPKQGLRLFAPMNGFMWNPLLKYPRNNKCPCLSGKKYKACCLPKLPPIIPEATALQYAEQMKKPDLIFITKENESLMKAMVEKKVEENKIAKTMEHEGHEAMAQESAMEIASKEAFKDVAEKTKALIEAKAGA